MLWTTVANVESLDVWDDAVPANTTSSLFWQYAHDDCEGPHLWVADDGLTSPQLSFHADLVPSDSRIPPLSRWGVGIGQNWAVYQGDFDPDPDVSFLWSLGWLSGGASQDREFYIHAGFDPKGTNSVNGDGYMFKHIVNVHMLQLDAFALWGVDYYPASVVGDFWPADNDPSAPANRSVIVQRSNRQAPVELAASVVSDMHLSRLGDNLRVQICNEGTMNTASNWSRGASWSLTGSDDSNVIINNGSTGATWTAPASGATARDFDVYLFHDQNHNQVCDASDPHRKLKVTILSEDTGGVWIDHIEYKMPGGDWTPAPIPTKSIIVPYTTSGVTVQFRAIKNDPNNNWPPNKPQWQILSGMSWDSYPSGDLASATFATASSQDGDKKFVVKCGNTKEVRITVVDIELKIGDTVFNPPDPPTSNTSDYAFISASPEMPDLKAHILPTGMTGWATWLLHIQYGRGDRTDDEPVGPVSIPAAGLWNIRGTLGTRFRGGKATVTLVNCDGQALGMQKAFHIRGLNPEDDDARDYITTNSGIHWYAYAIAKHESYITSAPAGCHYYNQFNPPGTLGIPNPGPNYSDPVYNVNMGIDRDSSGTITSYGWGMMQLTNPIPTAQCLWNWKSNVAQAVTRLDDKRGNSDFATTHTTLGLPAYIDCMGTRFTHQGNEQGRQTYHELDTIKRYNSGVFFTYNDILQRWTFVLGLPPDDSDENVLDYTQKVMREYQ